MDARQEQGENPRSKSWVNLKDPRCLKDTNLYVTYSIQANGAPTRPLRRLLCVLPCERARLLQHLAPRVCPSAACVRACALASALMGLSDEMLLRAVVVA